MSYIIYLQELISFTMLKVKILVLLTDLLLCAEKSSLKYVEFVWMGTTDGNERV